VHRLERGLSFLATIASSGPFVGLFGTVVGIMNSFESIGASGSASLAVVAPGIAEALVATAVGLFAAIPAAVGYNYTSARLNRLSARLETFCVEFCDQLRRSATRAA
jgi:biopolymer transport protein TolQ